MNKTFDSPSNSATDSGQIAYHPKGIALDTWLFSLFFSMILVTAAISGIHRLNTPERLVITQVDSKQELAQAPVEDRFAALSENKWADPEFPAAELALNLQESESKEDKSNETELLSTSVPFDAQLFNDEIRLAINAATENVNETLNEKVMNEKEIVPDTIPNTIPNVIADVLASETKVTETVTTMASAAPVAPAAETAGNVPASVPETRVLLAIADSEAVVYSNPGLASIQSLDESGSLGLAKSGTYAARLAKIVTRTQAVTPKVPSDTPVADTVVTDTPVADTVVASAPVVSTPDISPEPETRAIVTPSPFPSSTWAVAESRSFRAASSQAASLASPANSFVNVSLENESEPAMAPSEVEVADAISEVVPEEVSPEEASSEEVPVEIAAAAVGNELWIVQALTSNTVDSPNAFCCRRWNGSQWETVPAESFFNDQRPTTIFIHGNWGDMSVAVRDGSALWNRMQQVETAESGISGFRLVIWKWNSEKVYRRIREDCQYKAELADATGAVLSGFLTQLNETPVALVGFSYGARMIGSALNCQARQGNAASYSVVLVSAAADYGDFSRCGRFSPALSQMGTLLNIYNPSDKALKFYPMLYGHGGPSATGIYPLNAQAMTAELAPVTLSVNTSCCGAEHSFVNSLACIPASYLPKYFFPPVFP